MADDLRGSVRVERLERCGVAECIGTKRGRIRGYLQFLEGRAALERPISRNRLEIWAFDRRERRTPAERGGSRKCRNARHSGGHERRASLKG